MAFKPRHYWLAERIAQTFSPAVSESDAKEFVRERLGAFNALLEGEGASALFVFYQNPGSDEPESHAGQEELPSQLYLADPATEQLRAVCCYFARSARQKSDDVIYGELQPSLMQTFSSR